MLNSKAEPSESLSHPPTCVDHREQEVCSGQTLSSVTFISDLSLQNY